jgi:5'-nucleotidase
VRTDAEHPVSFLIVTPSARISVACALAVIAGACGVVGQGEATVDVQLLAFGDFHGALEPPAGGGGRIGEIDAGGIEFLATHVARLRAENPNSIVVSAGDNIGATPFPSSPFHDEPAVEALNLLGLQISAIGNHELDESWPELYRMQKGGCHPVDGCQDGTPYAGASFTYLAANVTLDPTQADPAMVALAGIAGRDPRPLVPGTAVREVGGVRVGFIGLLTQDTPEVTVPTGVRGLAFEPLAERANEAARTLVAQGIRAIVVVMHEGGLQRGTDINGCEEMSRDLLDLVNAMSDDIDVVVTGHSHQAYTCTIDGRVVTGSASSGRVLTDIDLRVRRSDGEVVARTARNIIVTRDVPPDPAQTALVARYRTLAEPVAKRVVGTIAESFTRAESESGESALGHILADASLEATRRMPGGEADFAFWNPGGIRADLSVPPGGAPAPVTFEQVAAVMPFGNELIVKTLTGDAIAQLLEQQFSPTRTRIMQVSEGFGYTYDPSRPRGQRVDRASIRIKGAPLDPARRYRVATNNFLWGGGDELSVLLTGTDPVQIGVDIDLVVDYLSRHSPVRPVIHDRIRLVGKRPS